LVELVVFWPEADGVTDVIVRAGVTVVVSWLELFPMLLSNPVPMTAARLMTGPEVLAVAVIVTVALAPLDNEPTGQVTVPQFSLQAPPGPVPETKLVPPASTAVNVTPPAALPEFATTIV
jgi:hypothetical protein